MLDLDRKTVGDKPAIMLKDDGSVVWRVQKDGWVDEQPLDKGVAGWTETDDAKLFLPPVGSSGDGGGNGGSGGTRSSSNVPRNKDGDVDFSALARASGSRVLSGIASAET